MSKKQTRRSVSIRGSTYDRIRNHCKLAGVSMSEFVEEQIAGFFAHPGSQGSAAPSRAPEARVEEMVEESISARGGRGSRKRMSTTELQTAARIFTF